MQAQYTVLQNLVTECKPELPLKNDPLDLKGQKCASNSKIGFHENPS